jgi:hypothetical protein
MNFKLLLIIFSFLFVGSIDAQQNGDDLVRSKFAINSVAGVTNFKNLLVYDFGINVSKAISGKSKINFSLLYRTSAPILNQNWGKYPMVMNSDISSGILNFRYDYFPFLEIEKYKILRKVKLTGGVQYVENPNYSFKASLRDAVKWGQLTFSQEEVGWVDLNLKTNKLQPTLGIGYDGFFIDKKLTFGFDAGGVYSGYPIVKMLAHNMLEQTVNNAPRLEYNLRSYSVIPYLQFNIQFHFK